MFPLTALLTCDLMAEAANNQRLFYKLCSAKLSKMNQELDKLHESIEKTKQVSDEIDKEIIKLRGKGRDKLEQWRRGEIDSINPNDVDWYNWNIYLMESSKRRKDEWNKNHPGYFENLKKQQEEKRKHMTKEELAQDIMIEIMMM